MPRRRGQLHGLKASAGAVYRFRHDLLAHRAGLAAAIVCALAYGVTRVAEPWPLKVIFDNALAGMRLDTPFGRLDSLLADDRTRILAAATVTLLALALLRSGFYYAQRLLTARIAQEIVLTLRRRLFAHMQRLPLSFHMRSSTGDLLTRLTGDVNALRELLVASLLSVVSEGALLVGFVVVMVLIDWQLALVALGVMPVVFALVLAYSSRIRAATRKQRRREGEIASRLHEVLSGIHVVQLYAQEEAEDLRLRSLNRRSLRSGLKATRLEARLNRGVELAVATATAAALWFGATQVIERRMTTGDLVVFIAYMQGFYRPLRRISRVTQRAAKASTSLERVTSVLEQRPDLPDGAREAPPFRGAIDFENVDFSYVPGKPVLRGIDLSVRAGETVALVGPTGAGKSTLLGLVPRLYDPAAGAVRIDAIDVRELTVRSLREQIAVVPQDGMLFAGTIYENLAYGRPDAGDDEVEDAARTAGLHEFVSGLPEGYGTLIGERGVTLSGGQRQRLAIGRALLKDAPIVLLDEPTTSLDPDSETLVLAALQRLLAGRTAVIVAHRPATLRLADVVVRLDGGRIVDVRRAEAAGPFGVAVAG